MFLDLSRRAGSNTVNPPRSVLFCVPPPAPVPTFWRKIIKHASFQGQFLYSTMWISGMYCILFVWLRRMSFFFFLFFWFLHASNTTADYIPAVYVWCCRAVRRAGRQLNHPCYTFLRPGNDVKNLWNPEGWLGWLRYEEKWSAGFKTQNVAANKLHSPHFMELWGSLPHSQQSTACRYSSPINPFLCPSHFWQAQLVSFLVGLRTYQHPDIIIRFSVYIAYLKRENKNIGIGVLIFRDFHIAVMIGGSQWPSGLRRRSTAVRLLGLWLRIPPGVWTFVCCECCVCCQVEISATSWPLVQGSPTDCGASLCVTSKPPEWGAKIKQTEPLGDARSKWTK